MNSTQLQNHNSVLMQLARDLRNRSSLSDTILWNRLKSGKMYGYQFQRQKPLAGYIVDFYCPELKLAIEIENKIHERKDCSLYDLRRLIDLEEQGLHVLRFGDLVIKEDIEVVLYEIELYIHEFQSTSHDFMDEPADYLKVAV